MITAFLPCRSGSERVPNKNTKTFGGVEGGLLTIKLSQLTKVKGIDNIIVSTNDPVVKQLVKRFSDDIMIDDRPEELALSSTSTDELIDYVPSIIKEGHVLWTHTTSPFLDSEVYDQAIIIYKKLLQTGKNDSLMTVNKIQGFLWDQKGSVNYDRKIEKWPRTQTLKELYEINSGIFLNSVSNYVEFKDRIGGNPHKMVTEGIVSFDIDWPDDFEIGDLIYRTRR